MIKLHDAGVDRARKLIAHGKVSDRALSMSADDRAEMLGPNGTDVEEFATHHLGVDDKGDPGDPKSYRYPFGKLGQVHTRALTRIAERARSNGHDEVADAAAELSEVARGSDEDDDDSQTTDETTERSARRRAAKRHIIKRKGKYWVVSEDYEKDLGGPYDTEEEAKKRLMQVEYFKHEKKSRRSFDLEAKIGRKDGKWYVLGKDDDELSGPHDDADEAKEALGDIIRGKEDHEDAEASRDDDDDRDDEGADEDRDDAMEESLRSFDLEARIVEEDGKWYVVGEDDRHISGPHDTEDEAKEALGDIIRGKEDAEDKEAKSLRPRGETRTVKGLKLRSRSGSNGPGTLVGYAAVYDRLSEDLGGFREVIKPGAFAGVLNQDVRALANHDPSQLLGRSKAKTLRMREDDLGVAVEVDLADNQAGRDTAVSVRRGDMDGMSFSFVLYPGDDEWDLSTSPPTRTIHRFREIFDVGPVTYPAYAETSAAMRSLRMVRRAARAVSLSLAKARQAVAEALLSD